VNLEQTIHTRWEADETLNGLLPVARLTTGPNVPSEWPWAELHPPGGQAGTRTNEGDAVNLVNVQIDIHHDIDHYDAAKTIAEAVKSLFLSEDFDLSGSSGADKVLDVTIGTPQATISPDGTEWVFVVVLNCRVYLSTGV
jgi:hypothetical protein